MKLFFSVNINIYSLLFCFLWLSCNSQPKQDSKYKHFECAEAGWSFEYPSDWSEYSKEEIAKVETRGREAMEMTADTEIEMNTKNILWLKKDPFNSFTSTLQPSDSISRKQHSEDEELLNQTIIDTYKSQGIEFDYKTGKQNIDDLEFHVFEATIYTPDRKTVLLNQIVFDRLIGDKTALTLSLNYNNEKDKQALLHIIGSSKFKIRD
jgi:hypothetical protein